MRRRVAAEDLRRATGLMRQQGEREEWIVFDEYEIYDEAVVAKHLVSPETADYNRWGTYKPLEAAPDLFLKLAAMHDAPNFTEAALAFSHRYGVPGRNMSHLGGTGSCSYELMNLSSWREEAKRAWMILKLYEAALNRDGEAVISLHAEYGKPGLGRTPSDLVHSGELPDGPLRLAHTALVDSVRMVARTVQLLCRPTLTIGSDAEPFRVSNVWTFDNLLGAMYLQMYWLIASNDDLSRCEYCGRTVALTRTHPEGRKRRRDKRFCDDACRQAHHRSKKKG